MGTIKKSDYEGEPIQPDLKVLEKKIKQTDKAQKIKDKKKKDTKEEKPSIKEIIKNINLGMNNKYAIYRCQDVEPEVTHRHITSSGCLTFDLAMECGGLPIPDGKIIHIWGDYGSSKTTLSYNIIREFQKQYPGENAMYFNLEQVYDEKHMKINGVNMNQLLPVQDAYGGEQVMKILQATMLKDYARLFVIDSVPGLMPITELKKSSDKDAKIGALSLFLSQNLPKILQLLNHNKFKRKSIIFINQPRTNIGQRYGDPSIPMGGRALNLYSHVTVYLKKKISKADRVYTTEAGRTLYTLPQQLPKGLSTIGHACEGIIQKSKVSSASCKNNSFQFRIISDIGIDDIYDMYKAGMYTGIIKQNASIYSMGEEKFKGINKLCDHLATLDYNKYRKKIMKVGKILYNKDAIT